MMNNKKKLNNNNQKPFPKIKKTSIKIIILNKLNIEILCNVIFRLFSGNSIQTKMVKKVNNYQLKLPNNIEEMNQINKES